MTTARRCRHTSAHLSPELKQGPQPGSQLHALLPRVPQGHPPQEAAPPVLLWPLVDRLLRGCWLVCFSFLLQCSNMGASRIIMPVGFVLLITRKFCCPSLEQFQTPPFGTQNHKEADLVATALAFHGPTGPRAGPRVEKCLLMQFPKKINNSFHQLLQGGL